MEVLCVGVSLSVEGKTVLIVIIPVLRHQMVPTRASMEERAM